MSPFSGAVTPPVPDLDSAGFWEGCKAHRLLIRACNGCGRGHYPPGPICPWCQSWDIEWREVAGRGRVRTFVIFRHPFVPELKDALPYTIVRVEIEELPDAVLHGRLDGDAETIAIGDRVAVSWVEAGEGYVIPNWKRVT